MVSLLTTDRMSVEGHSRPDRATSKPGHVRYAPKAVVSLGCDEEPPSRFRRDSFTSRVASCRSFWLRMVRKNPWL